MLIKTELEAEFGGFVDVFVSSDGTTIPAGHDFLQKVQQGLADCDGALYLISPTSVLRPWIHFELGAVWIRSLLRQEAGGSPIPTVPLCHSGMTKGSLPVPLDVLNATLASSATDLRSTFASLQASVGGSGSFRTDFSQLATKVQALERAYTVGQSTYSLLRLLVPDVAERRRLVAAARQAKFQQVMPLRMANVEASMLEPARALVAALGGHVTMTTSSPMLGFSATTVANTVTVELKMSPTLILDIAERLVA